jgi:putative PIN family toxin of toxin-antitoxin system
VKVVLDTNVVASGIFFGGVPGRILAAWVADEFTLVLSPAILMEYRRVGEELQSAYPSLSAALDPLLTLIATNSVIVDAVALPARLVRDEDDDKFIAAAIAGRASVVVTGDKDLHAAAPPAGLEILTPRRFVDRYLRAGDS